MSLKAIEAFIKHKENMDKAEIKGEDLYFVEFRKLRDESDKLKSDPFYSMVEGEKSSNLPKNRYKDILPFDYNRVKLKETSEADTDYINASFIKSTGGQNYIAAQGPLPRTVNDFWSMIWDYSIRIVIMACQEYEGHPSKMKCFRYWSQSKEEELVFGRMTVKLVEESILPNTNGSVVRRELLVRKDRGETRSVIQFHHTRWPDKFIPSCFGSILSLLEQLREYHGEERSEPVLVHCSAGCGRTGSLLVIDYIWSMLKKGKIPESFCVFDVIMEMRRQRMAIVQSLDQYQFVYGAVVKLFQEKNLQTNSSNILPDSTKSLTCPEPKNSTVDKPAKLEEYTKPIKSPIRILPIADIRPALPTKGNGPVEKPRFVRATERKYKGYDIGFPNRVPKPRGPRSMPNFA